MHALQHKVVSFSFYLLGIAIAILLIDLYISNLISKTSSSYKI